jgi:hypothetical protein
MPQKVARSNKTDSPYESRAETEAAVERIHGHFKNIKAAITKEKSAEASATAGSHPRQLQNASDREALRLSFQALTEARDSLTTAHKAVCTSIDTLKRAMRGTGTAKPKSRS